MVLVTARMDCYVIEPIHTWNAIHIALFLFPQALPPGTVYLQDGLDLQETAGHDSKTQNWPQSFELTRSKKKHKSRWQLRMENDWSKNVMLDKTLQVIRVKL